MTERHRHIRLFQKSSGSEKPFFLIHGDSANASLAECFKDDIPLFAFYHQGSDGRPMKYTSITTIARKYVESIKKVQNQGPYRIGGYSIGGVIAYEMALMLAQDDQVELLLMIDSRCPTYDDNRDFHNLQFRYSELRVVRIMRKAFQKSIIFFYRKFNFKIPRHLRPIYIMETYRKARKNYIVKPYNGKVVMIRSTEENFPNRSLGWSSYIKNLEIIDLPGNHHSILDQENITRIAEIIKSRLV